MHWEVWNNHFVVLIPGTLWLLVVVYARGSPISQIDLFYMLYQMILHYIVAYLDMDMGNGHIHTGTQNVHNDRNIYT